MFIKLAQKEDEIDPHSIKNTFFVYFFFSVPECQKEEEAEKAKTEDAVY